MHSSLVKITSLVQFSAIAILQQNENVLTFFIFIRRHLPQLLARVA